MRTFPFAAAVLCLFLTSLPVPAAAQAQDQLHLIETNDGNRFIGTLVSEDSEKVVVRTSEMGEFTIFRTNIKSLSPVDAERIKNGQYWFVNPHATRYFFSPSAIGLRQGEGYYQNTWVFFNNANIGLTDNFSIGGGFIPTFLFGMWKTPAWLQPKISIPIATDNVYVSVGALVGGVLGELDQGGAGIVYATTTFGSPDRNVSPGIGFGFAGSEWASTPMVSISGMLRKGRTLYVISENYLFPGVDGFLGFGSLGVRWAPEIFAVDFALIRELNPSSSYIGIPWLSVTFPFGR